MGPVESEEKSGVDLLRFRDILIYIGFPRDVLNE